MLPFRPLFCSLLIVISDCNGPTPPSDGKNCVPAGSTGAMYCRLIDNAGNPDWSPTGERFAFLRIADSMLCLYYFADKHVEALTNGEEPDFSPDGRRLVYEWRKRIYIIDIDTRVISEIAPGAAPAWSENALWIAYSNPTAFKRKHTGQLIEGLPNPDSSLYVYDVQSGANSRVIINDLNPPSGPEVGITYPTWVLKDSFIVFATESRMAAVKRHGGGWEYIDLLPSPDSMPQRLAKEESANQRRVTQFLGAGRSSWNPRSARLLFEYGTQAFPSGLDYGLYVMVYGSRWVILFSSTDDADPSWAYDSLGTRMYVSDDSIWVLRP